jgi:hypothetical protein
MNDGNVRKGPAYPRSGRGGWHHSARACGAPGLVPGGLPGGDRPLAEAARNDVASLTVVTVGSGA